MFLKELDVKKKINTELRTLAIKISKIFGLGYAGIDIKLDEKKIAILEINGIPSWKGMQKIEKKIFLKFW